QLEPGDTILLFGELGSGKTTIIKGICEGLGIKMVKSPSFVIINIYNGLHTVYHIDLYRVDNLDLTTASEIAEYIFDEDAIKTVEWADRLPSELVPPDSKYIYIEFLSENERKITLKGLQ
ncbi:MAG TPA: tRNA (adenosine(37)-N6)-threonylcarbamoyltransferase complex ATPase subunit type 1 TsaE, partial [candidate division Zixibacteria bacterium]|nr:tRNA (adenosine(37)-N6)-threonylcarbamoyltransferase complex ATPase subunit type 1 TsaE [candidate division Zixibacteria bacterium]